MRTTALRTAVCAACLCAWLFAAQDTPFAALAQIASGLSRNDVVTALEAFDSNMKDYGAIESRLDALAAQADVLCSIDVVEEKDGRLDVDWYLELKSHAPAGPTERRREKVTLQMKKFGNKWKISSISSLNILAPLEVH